MGAFIEKVFLGILNMSLTASIVILAVLIVRLFLRKVPKIFSYLLWMVVLFRLLCPFSFEADFSLLGVLTETTQEQGKETFAPMQGGFFEMINVTPDRDLPVHAHTLDTSKGVQAGGATVTEPLDVKEIALKVASVIWLVGVGSLLIYSVVTLFSLKGKLKTAEPVGDNVYVTKAVDTPFVIGVIKPGIYLPAQLLEDEKSYILMHERIHIKRGDHIVKIVGFLALCLHWFNPLVWLSFFLLGKDMEMSCDEAVIRKAGGDVKKEYSASLLSLATGKRIVNGVPLAFGEGDTGSRIRNVLKYKKPATIVAVIALVVCVVVAAVLLANPGKQKQSDGGNAVGEVGSDDGEADDSAGQSEVLYGVVTDVEFDGAVRRLLVIPNLGEIEIPDEAEIVMNVDRESKELWAGDLVEITFAPGERVSVLETWPGRFSADAKTITVLWQDCGLTYEGDDVYQFSFPASLVTNGTEVDDTNDTRVCVYRGGEDGETERMVEMPNWMWEEDVDGNRIITVRIAREFVTELLQLAGSDIRLVVEKETDGAKQESDGAYMISVRSIDAANRAIDVYVSDHMSSYDGDAPLQFAENCVFKINSEYGTYDFKETSFEAFTELIGEEDATFNQPCLCTFVDNEITEICLISAWNAYGISVDDTPPTGSFCKYVMEEEGAEVFAECYSLVRTETADISAAPGEEIIEIYTGDLGDGESGFVLFKDAEGKLLYVQDAHSARAGWNNIYVGENENGPFILNVYVEDRWDFGGYGYWAYRLDEKGAVQMIEGSMFSFELAPVKRFIYEDDRFREWIAPMEAYLKDSHLLLSTQDGEEVRTEAVSDADRYSYDALSLKGR